MTIEQLREVQSGAIFDEESGIPLSFGHQFSGEGWAICDRSHWGLIRLQGADRQRFLHNQTTNQIQSLKAGQGCETVFVNSTGRTLDLATVWVTEEGLLVFVSPSRRQFLMDWMDRYLFPMDKVELADISDHYAVFSLLGDFKPDDWQDLGFASLINQPDGFHQLIAVNEISYRLARGTGLAIPGFTLIVPMAAASRLWSSFIERGVIPLGDRDWESLRIQQGRPAPDRELTEDYNPLEAGLWNAISFDKGCYIGQETIARLNTYKGVKQRLWGFKLSQSVDLATPITLAAEKIGILTSVTETDDGVLGLGYLKTKAGGEGLTVQVGSATAIAIAVPFLSHDYYQSKSP